jgi:serine/threonine-protein kinase
MEGVSAVTTHESDRPAPDSVRPMIADPLVGLTVADRYRILGPIGSGGMGVVYKVEHVRIGKLMAMKLLAGELSRDVRIVKRFKREAELASRLSHPSTVQVFDFGQADGLTYLIMELVPGDDLGKIAKAEGPMGHLRVSRMLVQICGSLAEAHGLGIVHRDLKPENVLVVASQDARQEIVKVCDFGLAKLRESTESSDVTGHGSVVGTPYYMSPEQIRGEDVDAGSDIYSFGALMYRLLTGNPPFTGQNPMAVFAKHLTEKPVPPSERLPSMGIPKSIDQLVLKTLEKKREDRFARITEVQEELLSILRAGNVSSAEMLVDSGQLRQIASNVATIEMENTQLAGAVYRQAATRNEVEAYEKKLVQQRRFFQVAVTVGVLALGAAGARAWTLATAPAPFDGKEIEPNNDASQANEIPFGTQVTGYIGKRMASGTSDRDFFSMTVPAGVTTAHLRTTALPNFPICTRVYRAGISEPIARFCTGAANKALEIPALRVDAGRYLLAVLQDVDPYGKDQPPPAYENVSDPYTLDFGPAGSDLGFEIEPNDSASSANRVALGGEVRGTLGFVRDVDVFCPEDRATGNAKWTIKDAVDRPRDAGAVLEATIDRGVGKDPLRVMVHRKGVSGALNAQNVASPYASPAFHLEPGTNLGCLTLRLAWDPWSTAPTGTPPTGNEPYVITLEAMP